MRKYEYKFVRLGEGGWLGIASEAKNEYQMQIQEHAAQGWRLVQVFAPGTGAQGHAAYFELIFEREV
jgi:hypothetical protein